MKKPVVSNVYQREKSCNWWALGRWGNAICHSVALRHPSKIASHSANSHVDLGTRHGLKKVHSDFDKIHKKLDAAYVGAQSRHMEKLMGGIVGIWAKMCADSILRDKLFKEGKVPISVGA